MARKTTRNEEHAGGFPPSMEAFQSLTSHPPEAELLGGLIRRHWVLDMTFDDEDQYRVRKGHAAENLALQRKLIRVALCEKILSTLMKLDISQ